jgi:type IV pilus assembly protein PilA
MLALAKNRRRGDEAGFTLIELMIVVMIIAILVTIAIPAFLGARKRAQDSAARSNVRNALSTAQTIFSETQDYTGVTVAGLTAEEPSLSFVAGASTGPKNISVSTGTDRVVLAAKSASGKCFFLRHVATTGAADSGTQQATSTGACDAASLVGLTFTTP